jgi:hypothetical protein
MVIETLKVNLSKHHNMKKSKCYFWLSAQNPGATDGHILMLILFGKPFRICDNLSDNSWIVKKMNLQAEY